jgi:hypothetical protein
MTTLYCRKKTDKIGFPQNENQKTASKENFLIFLLTGAISSLSHFSRYNSLTNQMRVLAAIGSAIYYMKRAIEAIKFEQGDRKRK